MRTPKVYIETSGYRRVGIFSPTEVIENVE